MAIFPHVVVGALKAVEKLDPELIQEYGEQTVRSALRQARTSGLIPAAEGATRESLLLAMNEASLPDVIMSFRQVKSFGVPGEKSHIEIRGTRPSQQEYDQAQQLLNAATKAHAERVAAAIREYLEGSKRPNDQSSEVWT